MNLTYLECFGSELFSIELSFLLFKIHIADVISNHCFTQKLTMWWLCNGLLQTFIQVQYDDGCGTCIEREKKIISDSYHNRWPSHDDPVSRLITRLSFQCIFFETHHPPCNYVLTVLNIKLGGSESKKQVVKEGKKNRDKVSGSLVSTAGQIFQLVWESMAHNARHFSFPRNPRESFQGGGLRRQTLNH